MYPVFPDGTRELTAISATQAHPASARRQLGQPATGQHLPGPPAAVAFQCESNQAENGKHSSKRFRYSRRSNSSSVGFTWGHSLWSRKIFKMVTASADAFAERATWQDFLPGSAEAVSLHPAADEFYYGTCASTQGCAHIARKPRRSKIRHAISLARWLHALAYSTWRAGDAVRKGTQSEQARLSGNRSPTHEMASRLSHATQNPLFADTSSVVNGQDMSSTTTCLHETT